MLVRQMLEIYDLLDTPQASGEAVAALLRERVLATFKIR